MSNRVHLLALSEREFRRQTGVKATEPVRGKFKAMSINLAKFDSTWDKKRGAAARMMSVLLRDDDEALQRRVCESEKSARTYGDAADWLEREAAHLRKTAKMHDTAANRLKAVLTRCNKAASVPDAQIHASS